MGQYRDRKIHLIDRETGAIHRFVTGITVRELVPADQLFPRSRFRRRAISEHLSSRRVTGSTVNRHRAALMQFGKWLVEREILEYNPVRDIRSARENPARTVHHAPSEVEALVRVLPEPYRALEAVMAACGMELQACLRLRRRDVDLEAGTIHAHGGKNAWRDRVCQITELWTLDIIEHHVRDMTPMALVFEGIRGEAALAQHKRACQIAKVPASRLHDHRHTYAVNAIRRGMPVHLVAAQLGHRDSTLVQRVYGKFAPQAEDFGPFVSHAQRPHGLVGRRTGTALVNTT